MSVLTTTMTMSSDGERKEEEMNFHYRSIVISAAGTNTAATPPNERSGRFNFRRGAV